MNQFCKFAGHVDVWFTLTTIFIRANISLIVKTLFPLKIFSNNFAVQESEFESCFVS